MNELLITALLILIAGIIVCIETAIISLGRMRVHQLVEEKRRGAQSLQTLYRSIEDFVYTSKVVTLFFLLLAAAISGLFIARFF